MQISTCLGGVTGYPQGLSTRTGLFSTRYRQALHVRDLDFVRVFHKCTYRGTGADSRVVLPSAPAMQSTAIFILPALNAPRATLHASGVSVTV
jgi:hypothetical protein